MAVAVGGKTLGSAAGAFLHGLLIVYASLQLEPAEGEMGAVERGGRFLSAPRNVTEGNRFALLAISVTALGTA